MCKLRRRTSHQGFSLLELLVILAVVGLAVLIGFPALMNTIRRARVETTVKEAAMEVRTARLEAVRRSVNTYVEADFENDRLVVWREADGVDGLTDNDVLVRETTLPSQVRFWAPGEDPEGPEATVGLTARDNGNQYFTFLASGAASATGAIRFADTRGNFLEVRVDPPATAKVTLRKYDDGNWLDQGAEGRQWTWH
jgi:prepilin-type N-terminal cleavage/methylation domain-containing protein